jgi:hypothetical protein
MAVVQTGPQSLVETLSRRWDDLHRPDGPLAGPEAEFVHGTLVSLTAHERSELLDGMSDRVIENYERRQAHEVERYELSRATAQHLRVLLERFQQGWSRSPIADGMLRLDAHHVALAEELSTDECADEIRDEARARLAAYIAGGGQEDLWRPWLEADLFHLLRWLGPEVWASDVKPRVSGVTRQSIPALSHRVLEAIRKAFLDPRRKLRLTGGTATILDRDGEPVAFATSQSSGSDGHRESERVLGATQRLTGHRLLRWVVSRAFSRVNAHTANARTIRVPGGLSGLAESLRLSGRKGADEVREALDVFQAFAIEFPDGSRGHVLRWHHRPAAPGRPAEVLIDVAEPLCPIYIARLPKGGLSNREARMLVPVPEDPPPLPRHPRHHAAAALLQLRVLAEIRDCASALVTTGWVRIPGARWRLLCEESAFPFELLGDLLRAWAGADSPGCFLEQNPSDQQLFRIDPRAVALSRFLEEAGRMEERGRLRQRRSSEARARGRAGQRSGRSRTRRRTPPVSNTY